MSIFIHFFNLNLNNETIINFETEIPSKMLYTLQLLKKLEISDESIDESVTAFLDGIKS